MSGATESAQRISPFSRFRAKVWSILSALLNPVRKILSFTMQGDDQPGSISVFHSRLVSALRCMGGSVFSGAIPEAFGPRNWSQCMDSAWNLYRPFDPVSQELSNRSIAIGTVLISIEELIDKLKLKRAAE